MEGLDKKLIIEVCGSNLLQKKDVLLSALREIEESMLTETKSSLGDKHETSRAKMQVEQEKLGKQLQEIESQLNILHQIDHHKREIKANFGALVTTNFGTFFISVGLGRIQCLQKEILAVSPLSPIAKAFDGLTIQDSFIFNEKQFQIKAIE